MAMNPMQRKVRNSFLFGFVVALLIGAVVAGLLIMKNKQAQEEIVKIQEENKLSVEYVYALTEDVEQGEYIAEKITKVALPKQYVPDNAITEEVLKEYENENEQTEMLAKVEMKANTPLTTTLVEKSPYASTYRMVEYNMISLPSMLKEEDYIDIRLACLGYESIVLSKVQVKACNSSTIWLKLSESQLLTLNYAIIESYIIKGTKLYATQYTDATQVDLNTTYVPDYNTVELILKNIDPDGDEGKFFQSLYEKNGEIHNKEALQFRTSVIEELRNSLYSEEDIDAITEGYNSEKSNTQAAREALMGDLGY